MSDAPELSNVARVLISRMESHPEDFDHSKRFGYLQDSLMQLIGVQTNNPYGGVGRLAYLSEADRTALAEAWRALNYVKFEKEIMDTVFKSDAEFEEEKKKYAYPIGQSTLLAQQSQRAQLQNQMLAASTGALHPAQNASQNAGGGFLGLGGLANVAKGLF